ncbi:rhamnulose-1-phosphate aldolase [Pediococcus parvulus]|uniref:Rhamnulose-1-phosphate aldolase n=1 Tax=Pediococcus parvulus TaxID=54062 RepID=A0AAP5TB05_9LACO|nr:rhamnulose-1-phosphate aldolase [Pediococcus parvulus]MDV7693962.1 rhamnulose-1-phosphate aldolase [Pediococcus parvulus]OAD63030.1 rhamnulose-1-phosphate aldolase [Pediococcus parvulus]
MKDFIESKYVHEMAQTTNNLYRHGWDERNGGNVSLRLTKEEVSQYAGTDKVLRNIPIAFDASELAGKYYLVTGTGRYFKNIIEFPERDLGLIRITDEGNSVDLMWGFNDGGEPTSEFPSHLMSHIERLKQDPNQRVIMHCHPTNLVAMSFTNPLNSKHFSRTLWKMHPESIVVFPEGVAVIPYMCPGTNEIGRATSEQMKNFRVVVWPHHGVFAAGESLDETYGLVETVEKSALIYTTIQSQGGKILQSITDKDLHDLCKRFNLKPNKEFLKPEKVTVGAK